MGEIADRSIGTKTDDVRTELGESAADWMIDPAEIALRFSWALFRFWEARGHGDEGGRWLNTILDAVPMPMPIRVDALNAAVVLGRSFGVMSPRLTRGIARRLNWPPQSRIASALTSRPYSRLAWR